MAKISIVIPVYNAEEYLERCINSILSQSEKNIEVILVNDGSTDHSYDICLCFQKQDTRVLAINKPNGGPHSARKTGTNYATSPYIAFVDSDDWIEEGLIEKLHEQISQNDADLVVCGFVYDEAAKTTVNLNQIKTGVYQGENLKEEVWCRMLCDNNSISTKLIPSMCAKLFRTEKLKPIVNDLEDMISMGEDLCCSFSYVLQSKRIVVDNNNWGYHYCCQEESITKIHDPLYFEKLLRTYKHIDNMLNKLEVPYLEDNFNRYKIYLIYRELGICANSFEKERIEWIINLFMPYLQTREIKKVFERIDINKLSIFIIPRKLLFHMYKQNKAKVKVYYYLWLMLTKFRLKLGKIKQKGLLT